MILLPLVCGSVYAAFHPGICEDAAFALCEVTVVLTCCTTSSDILSFTVTFAINNDLRHL